MESRRGHSTHREAVSTSESGGAHACDCAHVLSRTSQDSVQCWEPLKGLGGRGGAARYKWHSHSDISPSTACWKLIKSAIVDGERSLCNG
eukprot:7385968-Pyramimonas_sp.AAC.1